LSCNNDICRDLRRSGNVAARELDAVTFSKLSEAIKKFVSPALRQFWRKTQGKKAGQRLAAHGGNVAEATSETAVADALSWMPLAAKMNVFNGKVSGDEEFVPGSEAKHSTVVADALHHRAVGAFSGEAANALDQLLFRGNQGEVKYIEEKGLAAEKRHDSPFHQSRHVEAWKTRQSD
jgi:hypothetical protein